MKFTKKTRPPFNQPFETAKGKNYAYVIEETAFSELRGRGKYQMKVISMKSIRRDDLFLDTTTYFGSEKELKDLARRMN
tara:strand:+ start:199 stop:435 length:237 start_codon:yes stop_codon:yes gene_type:complete